MQPGIGFFARRRRTIMTIGALMTFGLSACGGPEEAEEAEPTTEAAPEQTEQYCADFLAIESAAPDIDFEAPQPEIQEGARQFAREDLRPLTDRLLASAPDEIRDELGVFDRAVTELESTGDFAVFETPEFMAADESVDEFTVEQCGWTEVEIVAVDYSYQEVPSQLEAGVYSFQFSNNGTEHHEMVIHRKRDGVTESFEELLALPPEQAEAKVTFHGFAEALPGEEGAHAVAQLTPGQYQVICFIPVGSTPAAEEAAAQPGGKEVAGPPHFTRGMTAEFTVS